MPRRGDSRSRRESRSPPRRGGGGGGGGGGRRGRSRSMSRSWRDRPRSPVSRYSPPPRRSGGRSGNRSRSRRDGRRDDRRDDRRPDPKKKAFEEKRIPPPAVRGPDKPQITEEQRANSVEFNGHYYAALDFTPPNQGGESAGQKTRIQMPYGWEVADITDDVRDAVVRLHTFGTDFVVGESGKAFHTAKGTRPGALEMIWDYKKDMGMYNLHQDGSLAAKNARILIRIAVPKV